MQLFAGELTNQNREYYKVNDNICYCCGNVGHRAKDPRCPAEGMSCNNCGKLGHFARVCRSRSNQKDQNRKNTSQDEINKRTIGSRGEIRYVYGASLPAAGESSSEDEYVFELGATGRMPHAIVKIGDFPVDLIVDSGATVNVLDNSTFLEINAQSPIPLSETHLKLFPYGSSTPLTQSINIHAEDYLKRKTIEKYVRCFVGWPPCS